MQVPKNVMIIGNVPHDWLFKHVSVVVHHGGAGTTAAGIAAGKPTIVVPFFGDQPFWGAMVEKTGAGPAPIPCKQLTSHKLSAAIHLALQPHMVETARLLQDAVGTERGCDNGAAIFHVNLPLEDMRCSLVPGRTAVWRSKRSKIRLSAFAATVLERAGLIRYADLKLQEIPATTLVGNRVLTSSLGTAQSNMISKMDHGIHFLGEQLHY